MKKVHLNLINIGIKIIINIYSFLSKNFVFILFAIFISCDAPEIPSWETQVNFPVLDSEYLFSDMSDSEGIVIDENGLYVLEFGNTILDGMGVPPEYFLTSELILNPISFSVGELIGQEMDIDPINVDLSIPINFDELIQGEPCVDINGICVELSDFFIDGNCIPREVVNNINISGTQVFPFPESNLLAIYILFEYYDYLTINDATIIPDNNENSLFVDSNFLFPIDVEYQVIGYEDNILFTHNQTQLNSEKNINDQIEFYYTITAASNPDPTGYDACDECVISGIPFPCDGWEYQSASDYSIDVSGQMSINNIHTITGQTKETIIEKEPSLPLIANAFDILEGEISSRIIDDVQQTLNKLEFNVYNASEIPLTLSIDLMNFKDEDGNNLDFVDFIVNEDTDIHKEKYFNDSTIEYYPETEDGVFHAIDEIFLKLNMIYPAQTGTFEVSKLLSFNVYNVSISSIEFDKITTVVHDFIIEAPSLSLSAVPSGIEGVEFVNPILTINLDNQIGINNTLTFNLESFMEGESVSELIIEAPINIPLQDGVTSQTSIVIEQNTYKIFWDNILLNEYPLSTTLVEFLKNQSDELRVSGQASLNGQGNLEPGDETFGKTISGNFELDVPFTMILGELIEPDEYLNINMVTAQSSLLNPMDNDTYGSIQNSLLEASLVSNIENHSPLVGIVSILVSTDENFFPLNIDNIVNDPNFSTCLPCTYYKNDDNVSIFNQIIDSLQILENNNINLNIGSSDGIDSIKYIPLNPSDPKIKSLKLYADNDSLLIGRLAMLELPYPTIDDNGDVQQSGKIQNYSVDMDSTQISLINYSDVDKPRFLNTLISLVNSCYPDFNNDPLNESCEINLYATDFITILSYASFIINPGEY